MTFEETKTIQNMIRFGGSFVSALGRAAVHADPINLEKIKNAFPDYWDCYTNFKKEV
jgi:hypothetical protein